MDHIKLAQECGAISYSPPPMRAARGLTFTFAQLGDFVARVQAQAAPAAQAVELPEPEAYLFQHEDTGQTMFVEAQQVEWGFEANNPRLQKIAGVYTEQQVRELLAAHGIGAAS